MAIRAGALLGALALAQASAPAGAQLIDLSAHYAACLAERPFVGHRVELLARFGGDGQALEARLRDVDRYRSDGGYRTAADDARRALLNPQCSLLPQGYRLPGDAILIFTPSSHGATSVVFRFRIADPPVGHRA